MFTTEEDQALGSLPSIAIGSLGLVKVCQTPVNGAQLCAGLSALPPAVNKDTTGERQEQGTVSCRRRGDGRLRVEQSRADQTWL